MILPIFGLFLSLFFMTMGELRYENWVTLSSLLELVKLHWSNIGWSWDICTLSLGLHLVFSTCNWFHETSFLKRLHFEKLCLKVLPNKLHRFDLTFWAQKYGFTALLKSIREASFNYKDLVVKKPSFFERYPAWRGFTQANDIPGNEGKCYRALRAQIVQISGGKVFWIEA